MKSVESTIKSIDDFVEKAEELQSFLEIKESDEYMRVYTDEDNKLLWAITKDGDIEYGAGVPNQIQVELDKKEDKTQI